jgi:hypothetical protein
MYVDDALWVGADELRREYLHVASENGQVDGMVAQQIHLSLLCLGFVGGGDRQIVEGNLVEVGEWLGCLMIADDEREIAA